MPYAKCLFISDMISINVLVNIFFFWRNRKRLLKGYILIFLQTLEAGQTVRDHFQIRNTFFSRNEYLQVLHIH